MIDVFEMESSENLTIFLVEMVEDFDTTTDG